MNHKTIWITLLIISVSAGIAIGGYNLLRPVYNEVTYESDTYAETGSVIRNSYYGFYHLYGYALTDGDKKEASSLADIITEDTDHSLAMLEINLNRFRNTDLPQNALAQLNVLLSRCERAGKKLLLRFLYDWDGRASETEPDSIDRILSHIDQVAPYVNKHKQAVYIMQGIFAGDCGEMHGSIYTEDDCMITIINHLNKMIDSDIFLGVRTPSHYRTITNRFEPINENEAHTGTLEARLSLFNDGMMGSDIDLGTYGDSSFANAANPKDKGTREEELEFQNKLCRYVPNGGECVLDNEYNDFDNAIKSLATMQVSYLNADHDSAVLNKWKQSEYSGGSIFNGMDGLQYIEAHLGYRYHITASGIDYNRYKSPIADIHITMDNSGFSPAYKKFTTKLILEHTGLPASPIIIDTDFDNRYLSGSSSRDIIISIDTNTLEAGTYEISLSMTDDCDSGPIILANKSYSAQNNSVPIGKLTVIIDE